MPLHPLADPPSRGVRLGGLAIALPATAFLFSSLLAFNTAQAASLAIKPFSRRTFRRFNRWSADTWWGWCVTSGQLLYDIRVVQTGDPIPWRENAIVIANHQQMPDITFLMAFARSRGRLGDLKWMVKDPIKYVPGVGWGMWLLECPFLKRNWADDRRNIDQTFARLVGERVPLWLVSFPEGTRLTDAKLAASTRYARDHGLTPLQHVLLPRTKGFVASVLGLRSHIDAVYDVTIGYEQGVPTLWQYVKGYVRRAHLHVRRYGIDSMPPDADGLGAWLMDRYAEKDQLLAHFYQHGRFEAAAPEKSPWAVAHPDG